MARIKAVLLDTHALLWYDAAPQLLSPEATRLLRDRGVTVYVSAISAWEIAIKVRAGKLPEAQPLLADYAATLSRLGFTELPFAARHGLAAGALNLNHPHRDPFDRALAAQAMLERLPLVSKDAVMQTVEGLKVIW
jgi:PIN domain nuclease of toxin-antitoxin system